VTTRTLLHNPENLEKLFMHEGFIAVAKDDYRTCVYTRDMNPFLKVPAWWYRRLNYGKRAINRARVAECVNFGCAV
jgi:hypothetical protein